MLVREGSRGRLEELIERWGRARPRRSPVHRRPRAAAARRRRRAGSRSCKGTIDHFFHLAAVYDMTATRRRNDALQRRRHRARRRRSSTRSSRAPAPRLVDRRRRRPQGPLPRGHVRRGPEAALRLPPHEVRVRADRARAARRSRGASTAPPSSSATRSTGEMDKIDGPYYFFKVDPAAARPRAAVGAAGRAGARRHEHRAGRLRRRARSTTSPTSPTSTARRSTSPTRGRSARATSINTFARAAHAPQLAVRIDKRLTRRAAEGRAARC